MWERERVRSRERERDRMTNKQNDRDRDKRMGRYDHKQSMSRHTDTERVGLEDVHTECDAIAHNASSGGAGTLHARQREANKQEMGRDTREMYSTHK